MRRQRCVWEQLMWKPRAWGVGVGDEDTEAEDTQNEARDHSVGRREM